MFYFKLLTFKKGINCLSYYIKTGDLLVLTKQFTAVMLYECILLLFYVTLKST